MTTPRAAIAAGLILCATPVAAAGERLELALTGPPEIIGCASIEGLYTAFVVPGEGIVLLSTAAFPGGSVAGEWSGESLALEIGGRTFALRSRPAPGPVPVWGLFDRSPDLAGGPGCLGFDKDAFTWESDLLTYLHFLVRDGLEAVRDAGAPPALRVGRRRVRLTVGMAGAHPVEIATTEGGMEAVAPPGATTRYLLRPFILDAATGEVLVKISAVDGPLFGAKARHLVETLRVRPAAPQSTTSTVPILEIGVSAIEPPL